jgi:polar amino acid transport system substrate-binding protein
LGIASERVQQALTDAKLGFAIKYQPWARAFHIAKTKPNVLIYPIYRTVEREALFHWFCPILSDIDVYAISKRDRKLDGFSLKELVSKGVTAGVTRGGNNYELLIEAGFAQENLDPSSTELANIRKLVHGRVDIVFQSKAGFEYGLKQLNVLPEQYVYGAALRKEGERQVCAAIKLGSNKVLVDHLRAAFTFINKTVE